MMFNLKNKKINKESGFTIMETLVAIFILLISITGPMVFAQNSLRAAFQSRDQITAFYLAQDAIEFVKNRRDHIALNRGGSDGWLGNLMGLCSDRDSGPGCSIDTASGTIRACTNNGAYGCYSIGPLKQSSTGLIGFEGDDTIFNRVVYIREIVTDEEAEVVVKIRWTSHDSIGEREIVVAENIYNWPGELIDND